MIYQLIMSLFALYYFPLIFFRAIRRRDANYFLQRLGLNLKEIKKRGVGGIWFHAVSVGETKALSGLIELFKEKYPVLPILISSQTPLGHETAKKLYPDALHFYMPFDCILIMKPLLKALLPKFLIFSETDWWFQLVKEAKKVHARTFIVSAKISERSTSRYQKFKRANLFKNFDGIICQNETYKDRFLQIGCPENILSVGGNLKYDMKYPKHTPEENAEFRATMGGGEHIIVLGSTHAPEEELLLNKLQGKKIWLVPRHPDRAPSLKKYANENVIIVDKMGMLLRCYECCDIAIVGGSFIEGIGGHNILEPLAYGKPTFFGPHMEDQFELVDLVKKTGAAKQITLDDLPEILDQNVGKFMETLSGASEKTLNTISLLSTMK